MDIKFKETRDTKSVDSEVAYTVECFMNAAKSLHKLHLKVKGQGSFSSHSALNGYDKFHEFADDLIESYQGAAEVILDIPSKVEDKLNSAQDAVSFLERVKQEVISLQSKLPYSEIINQLDLVKEHCNSMKYKLKFLS